MSLLYDLYINDQQKTVYALLRLLSQHANHNSFCNISWYFNELLQPQQLIKTNV